MQEQHAQLQSAAARMASSEDEFKELQRAIDELQQQLLEGERQLQETAELHRNCERELSETKVKVVDLDADLSSKNAECNQNYDKMNVLQIEKSSLQEQVIDLTDAKASKTKFWVMLGGFS